MLEGRIGRGVGQGQTENSKTVRGYQYGPKLECGCTNTGRTWVKLSLRHTNCSKTSLRTFEGGDKDKNGFSELDLEEACRRVKAGLACPSKNVGTRKFSERRPRDIVKVRRTETRTTVHPTGHREPAPANSYPSKLRRESPGVIFREDPTSLQRESMTPPCAANGAGGDAVSVGPRGTSTGE